MVNTTGITGFIVGFILLIAAAVPVTTNVIATATNLSATATVILNLVPLALVISALVMGFKMVKN